MALDFLVAAAFLAAVDLFAAVVRLVAAAFLAAVERLRDVDAREVEDLARVRLAVAALVALDFLVAAAFLAAVDLFAWVLFLAGDTVFLLRQLGLSAVPSARRLGRPIPPGRTE